MIGTTSTEQKRSLVVESLSTGVVRYLGFATALWFVTALILAVIGIGFVAHSWFTDRMVEVARFEGRFVTTEWELLAQLKAETDRLLLEKDVQILSMRDRLMRLMRSSDPDGASISAPESEDPRVGELVVALEEAYAEREELVARRLTIESVEAPPDSAPVTPDATAAVGNRVGTRALVSEEENRFLQASRRATNRLTQGDLDLARESLTEMETAIAGMRVPEMRTISVSVQRQFALLAFIYRELRGAEIRAVEREQLEEELLSLTVAFDEIRRNRNRALITIAELERQLESATRSTRFAPPGTVPESATRDREETESAAAEVREELRTELLLEMEAMIERERAETRAQTLASVEGLLDQARREGGAAAREGLYTDIDLLVSALLDPDAAQRATIRELAVESADFEALVYRMQQLALREISGDRLPFPVPVLIAIVVRPGAEAIRAELTQSDPPSIGDEVLFVPSGLDWDGAIGTGVVREVRGNRLLIEPEQGLVVSARDLVYRRPIGSASQ
ncbi:MAG: hypothetical protein MI724_06145 [Spirochaetales bacterium]|nr:hypothetical protein [Spirochaetales bacterium]